MEISLLNTLGGKKEVFLPKTPHRVGMYACGVTVYDHCHIGHGRSLFVFSLLKRFLEGEGYEVRFVRNITDVDDKIIARIRERIGGREVTIEALNDFVEEYIDSYRQDLAGLGLPLADVEPRATEYIEEMIGFVERLISLGYAYATDQGNVYYSVQRFRGYGKLSGRRLEELAQGVRKEIEEDKRDPLDFALWKAKKEGEPAWPSPWGLGRPGWHLECAVMSTNLLGPGFDIHGGGLDLIFPHHENEIAEAEPVIGGEFARYWIHHGMVTVEGEKMSKSLGNFLTLKDALSRYPARYWRLWYLTSHYRSPIDFSEEKMKEVARMQERIDLWYALLLRQGSRSQELDSLARELRWEVRKALADDLNTPKALGVLFRVIGESMEALKEGRSSKELLFSASEVFQTLFIEPEIKSGIGGLDEALLQALVSARQKLREHKEFALADEIRELLSQRGIGLEDTKQGSRWFYK